MIAEFCHVRWTWDGAPCYEGQIPLLQTTSAAYLSGSDALNESQVKEPVEERERVCL